MRRETGYGDVALGIECALPAAGAPQRRLRWPGPRQLLWILLRLGAARQGQSVQRARMR
jgi:hypothetical protein